MQFDDISLPTKQNRDFRLRIYRNIPGIEYVSVLYLPIKNINNIIPIRIHSSCFTGDILHSLRCDCREQLDISINYICDKNEGIIIYLPQEGRGIGLINKIKYYKLKKKGINTYNANKLLNLPIDNRKYDFCIDIINDFNIKNIELLTVNPDKINIFNNTSFNIIYKNITGTKNKYNEKYLYYKMLYFQV